MATRSTGPMDTQGTPAASASNGKATTAFILGIVGLIAALLIPILGLILGVVAAAVGHSARRDSTGWQANAGFWLGVLAIVVSIANMVLTAIILVD